jgi:(2Fe-2S) ferredoxin
VELFEKLKQKLEVNDPGSERTLVRKYPCFGGCEHGINVTLWPDRVFYSHVATPDLGEIVEHIEQGGEPVKRLTGIVKPDVEEVIWEMLDSPY